MFKNLICFILIVKLSQAQQGYMPKYYGQDSAIIVDRNKPPPKDNNVAVNYRNEIRLPPPLPLWQHYPRYRIIRPPPLGQILPISIWVKTENAKPLTISTITPTTTSSTSTPTTATTTTTTPKPTIFFITSTPFLKDDEFPKELLNIAKSKLGLKSLDEIPSISELGQFLGTNSSQETLNYIKQLTTNEQGVALMKAYIESADYTDSSGNLDNKNENEEDKGVMGDTVEAVKVNDLDLVVITGEETKESTTLKPPKTPKIIQKFKQMPKTHQSFMERIANLMHLNNLVDKNPLEQPLEINRNDDSEQTRITETGKKVIKRVKLISNDVLENQTESKMAEEQETARNQNLKSPILVRESIPYNYPVPIRIQSLTTTKSSVPFINPLNNDKTSVIHLNIPKILMPHVQQISRVTKIPTKKIEDFLASKPKLVELATKVSRFPINYDRNSPVEAQVMAAIQKAIQQDEDLKKLISSVSTLK